MIIDTHGHLVPPDLLAAIRKERARFPSLRLIEDGGGVGVRLRRRQADAADHEGPERHGGAARLDGQAGDRPPGGRRLARHGSATSCRRRKGEAWCRLINDALLAAAKASRASCRSPPCRCRTARAPPPCSRPPSRPAFPASMISTLPRGIGSVLDAADLDPFWAAADETGASSTSIRASTPATPA